jgi:hypothetical protein
VDAIGTISVMGQTAGISGLKAAHAHPFKFWFNSKSYLCAMTQVMVCAVNVGPPILDLYRAPDVTPSLLWDVIELEPPPSAPLMPLRRILNTVYCRTCNGIGVVPTSRQAFYDAYHSQPPCPQCGWAWEDILTIDMLCAATLRYAMAPIKAICRLRLDHASATHVPHDFDEASRPDEASHPRDFNEADLVRKLTEATLDNADRDFWLDLLEPQQPNAYATLGGVGGVGGGGAGQDSGAVAAVGDMIHAPHIPINSIIKSETAPTLSLVKPDDKVIIHICSREEFQAKTGKKIAYSHLMRLMDERMRWIVAVCPSGLVGPTETKEA